MVALPFLPLDSHVNVTCELLKAQIFLKLIVTIHKYEGVAVTYRLVLHRLVRVWKMSFKTTTD